MEFGLFTEFQSSAGRTDTAAFDESIAQMKAAEDYGFDAVWLGELHFQKDRSVLAAPLTVAAALAMTTRRVKIGIAVQVLPLSHPLRLAEDVATVDQLSKGRLDFGVGRSGLPGHYQGFNIPYGESRERFLETLEILKAAWTQERFSHKGQYFEFNDVCVMPKPHQRPHPPIRVAATSPDTFPSIGAQGFDIFAAVRIGTLAELAPNIAAYRAAYTQAGHPGKGQVFLRVPVYIADDMSRAIEEPQASIMQFYRQLGEQLEASASQAGARAVEQRDVRGRRLQEITFDEVLRDKVIVGTPDVVTQRLKTISDDLGLDGILAELNSGGVTPRAGVMRALQLLCKEVMPSFNASPAA